MRTISFVFSLALALLTPGLAHAQISDQRLGERIAESIRNYSRFGIFDDVNIEIDNRAVILTGRVTAPIKKDEIGKRVAKIDGVKSLTNDIGVLPLSQVDADLRVRVANAIYNHPTFWRYSQFPNPPIHIIVEGGHITLTGVVDSQLEKMLAFSLAQVSGSFTVTNKLRIGQ